MAFEPSDRTANINQLLLFIFFFKEKQKELQAFLKHSVRVLIETYLNNQYKRLRRFPVQNAGFSLCTQCHRQLSSAELRVKG